MTQERKNLIQGIIRAVRMCKIVKGEITAEVLVHFGREDEVTSEEASEVLALEAA